MRRKDLGTMSSGEAKRGAVTARRRCPDLLRPSPFRRALIPGKASMRIAAYVCWVFCLLGATLALADYGGRPGAAEPAPRRLPAALGGVSGQDAVLLVSVHPQCPCSRATAANLTRLLSQDANPPRLVVLTYRPTNTDEAFEATSLVEELDRLPRSERVSDPDGRLASLLGAKTSGHAVLYGADGRLLFQGGITAGRGHVGPNPGLEALTAALAGRNAETNESHPVYGCPMTTDRGSP